MPFIKCSKCGKNYSDKILVCPFCNTRRGNEGPSPTTVEPLKEAVAELVEIAVPITDQDQFADTKQCPFCAETILRAAIKCKHCGEFLNRPVESESTATTSASPSAQNQNVAATGVILHAITWVGILLTVFWVGESPLISASRNHGIVMVIVVVVSACVVAVESNLLGMGRLTDPKTGKSAGGPIEWLFKTLLLWAVFYPLYMFKRKRFGASGSGTACVVGVVGFLFVSVAMISMIEDKKTEVRTKMDRTMRDLEDNQREFERKMEELQRRYR